MLRKNNDKNERKCNRKKILIGIVVVIRANHNTDTRLTFSVIIVIIDPEGGNASLCSISNII